MFRKLMLAAILIQLGSPARSAEAQTCGLPQKGDEETVKRIEAAWLAAEYRGDVAFLDCLLDPGYAVIGARDAKIRSRADLLERVAKNRGKTTAVPPLTTTVVVNGRFATAYSSMIGQKADGQTFEAHFVDSYVFHDGAWHAVGGVDL